MGSHSYDQSVLAIPKILGEEFHLAVFYPQPRQKLVRQDLHAHVDEALSRVPGTQSSAFDTLLLLRRRPRLPQKRAPSTWSADVPL